MPTLSSLIATPVNTATVIVGSLLGMLLDKLGFFTVCGRNTAVLRKTEGDAL